MTFGQKFEVLRDAPDYTTIISLHLLHIQAKQIEDLPLVGFARLLFPISTRLGGNVDVVSTKPVQATDLSPRFFSSREQSFTARTLVQTPAKETDPRHMPPNFYYNQEDYLVERSAGKTWSWTAFRPSSICGFAVGNPMNMATVIAVYASRCKELACHFGSRGRSNKQGNNMAASALC